MIRSVDAISGERLSLTNLRRKVPPCMKADPVENPMLSGQHPDAQDFAGGTVIRALPALEEPIHV
jgi:hypothetical protein